jgi:phenylpyruvate tautomerase PptA (4-oxalocrotonate tautomerase family)
LLLQAIARNPGADGIEPEDMFIMLHEVPLDNWNIRGGTTATESGLGFKAAV